jgi:hypothetical protein
MEVATIENVSLGGALVRSRAPVRAGARVCLCLDREETEWVAAVVVGRVRVGWRIHLFRLEFSGPGTYQLFQAAACGLGPVRQRRGTVNRDPLTSPWGAP